MGRRASTRRSRRRTPRARPRPLPLRRRRRLRSTRLRRSSTSRYLRAQPRETSSTARWEHAGNPAHTDTCATGRARCARASRGPRPGICLMPLCRVGKLGLHGERPRVLPAANEADGVWVARVGAGAAAHDGRHPAAPAAAAGAPLPAPLHLSHALPGTASAASRASQSVVPSTPRVRVAAGGADWCRTAGGLS